MFVQVIQGRATDPQGLRSRWEAWDRELKPGSVGFLGSTAGIAEDGTFIMAARDVSYIDLKNPWFSSP